MKLRIAFLAAMMVPAAVTSAAAITPAGVRLVSEVVGSCGNPCVVNRSNGGRIIAFRSAAHAVRRGDAQSLVIDGYCASACMVLADLARPRVCITPRATFAFHKTNWDRPIPLRGDLHGWVMRNGGYPEFNGRPGIMSYQVAQRFFKTC